MDISKLNIGKLFKSNKSEKTEEKKNYPVADKENKVDEKSYKNYSKATAAYAMAALMALGVGTTGCQKQDMDVDFDTSGLEQQLNEIKNLLATMSSSQATYNAAFQKQLAQIIDLLLQNNSDNAELRAQLTEIVNQNASIIAILNGLRSDVQNFDEHATDAMWEIYNLLKESNANDDKFMAMLREIIEGQGTNAEKLDKLLDAINEQNQLMLNIGQLIATVGEQLGNKLSEFIKLYKAGTLSHNELLNKIYEELQNSNEINQEQLNGINQIIDLMKSGQLSESEGIEKILEILGSIDGKLDTIISLLGDVVKNQTEQTEEMKNFKAEFQNYYNDWKSGNITTNAFLAKIMQGIDNLNITDAEILGVVTNIQNQIENGAISDEKALAAITDLLQQIKDNTDTMVSELGTISGQISTLTDQLDSSQNKIIDLLSSVKANTSSIDSKISQALKNQEAANNTLVEISGKMDDAIAQLVKIENKTISKDDLKDLIGPMYNEIISYLDGIKNGQLSIGDIKTLLGPMFAEVNASIQNIGDKQITIEQLKAMIDPKHTEIIEYLDKIIAGQVPVEVVISAIESNRVDLTKTNALIETLTNVVQNLNFDDGTSADLKNIVDILNDLKAQGGADHAKIQQLFEEALAKLANIDKNGGSQLDALNALIEVAKGIKGNQETFMADANKFGIKLFEELEKLSNGLGNINKLVAYAESYKDALAQAEQTRQEQLAVLKAILENQGKNGNSLSIDDLKQIIPDYTDLLNEIKEAIGNLVTPDKLEAFFKNYQTDLTKTNALIETLTNVVQNKNFSDGAGSADMSRVESLLGQILDAYNSKKVPSESQIQDLLNAVNQVVQNTTAQTPAPASRAAMPTRAGESTTMTLTPEWIEAYNQGQRIVSAYTGKKPVLLPHEFYDNQTMSVEDFARMY